MALVQNAAMLLDRFEKHIESVLSPARLSCATFGNAPE